MASVSAVPDGQHWESHVEKHPRGCIVGRGGSKGRRNVDDGHEGNKHGHGGRFDVSGRVGGEQAGTKSGDKREDEGDRDGLAPHLLVGG